MLAYYFKVDPDSLNDEEYALKFSQMKWVLDQEAKKWQLKK